MPSRRGFIQLSCASAATLAMRSFGLITAMAGTTAATTGDYKALVCVFLFGGNDGNNMVVPANGSAFSSYTSVRGPIALPASSLLPVAGPSGQEYGLHASLKELQALYGSDQLALALNVGPLIQPLTKAQYTGNSAPAPANLFSHADQQREWQTSILAGNPTTGWGGRVADVMSPMNAPATFPAFVSVAGNTMQGTGAETRAATVNPGAPLGLQAGSAAITSGVEQLLTTSGGVTLVQAAASTLSNGQRDATTLSAALSGAKALTTPFPKSILGAQLEQVANIIAVRNAMGMKRQIFFCALGNFDTHAGQLSTQSTLLAQLSQGLNAFYQATEEMGVANQVTAFTESDFGRTLSPTSNLGSDHAWGNHHIVVGGAVKGGAMYGAFPTLALGGPDDTDTRGRWIPTTSIDQYGATLASWFGVDAASLPAVFPNLANFPARNIGFLG